MASQTPTLNEPLFSEPSARDGRRLLALPGGVAVAGALQTEAIACGIRVGATPRVPDGTTALALSARV